MSGTKKMNRITLNKYVKNWNMLDTVIYYIEIFVGRVKLRLQEEAEPAVEEIIDAETQYLQEEITYYRAHHQRPGRYVIAVANALLFSQKNFDQQGKLREQTFKKSVPNQVVKKQTNQMSLFDLDDQNRRMG